MIVPALFVACAIARFSDGRDRNHDLVIVTPHGHAEIAHREFAASRGILIDDSIALDAISDITLDEGRLTGATLMKLLLPEHYASKYDKILYLDADLTIHSDVSALFGVAMGNCPLAAVPSGRVLSNLSDEEAERLRSHFAALGLSAPYRFFNTGVMLMSTADWRAARVTERALDFLRRNRELCSLPDEDSLNAVLNGEILELSSIWNTFPQRLWASKLEPAIIHYAGDNKPWKRFGRHKRPGSQAEAYSLYQDFVRQTPWPNFLRSQWNAKDLLGSIACEAKYLWSVLTRRAPSRKPGGAAFARDLQTFHAETNFVDVEQGIVSREGSCIRARS
jgi:lipopolysaccharide biosynthesis glycosyltransferase